MAEILRPPFQNTHLEIGYGESATLSGFSAFELFEEYAGTT